MTDTGRLSRRTRLTVMGLTVAVTLTLVNVQIVSKERILRHGTTILLPLAPVDPRSLLQGDYMALRYAMAEEVAEAARQAGISDGTAVVRLNEQQQASFVALYRGQPLAPDERLLVFRKRGDGVRLASDAYFFEEGHGPRYERARFGELAVDAGGEAVLLGLRDADGRPMGPPPDPSTDRGG